VEILFNNATANGDGAEIDVPVSEQGGFLNRTIYITGTLDGATFTLYATADGTNWVAVPDSDSVLPSPVNVIIRAKKLKGNLAGGGASLDATVKMF